MQAGEYMLYGMQILKTYVIHLNHIVSDCLVILIELRNAQTGKIMTSEMKRN